MGLIGILDTETNKYNVEFGGDLEADKAIVKTLNDEVKSYSFKELLEHMANSSSQNENATAEEVKEYLGQHNGTSMFCDLKVCDAQGNYVPSGKNSTMIDLEEKVEDYVTKRDIDGEEVDCVEMIVGQITSVGGY